MAKIVGRKSPYTAVNMTWIGRSLEWCTPLNLWRMNLMYRINTMCGRLWSRRYKHKKSKGNTFVVNIYRNICYFATKKPMEWFIIDRTINSDQKMDTDHYYPISLHIRKRKCVWINIPNRYTCPRPQKKAKESPLKAVEADHFPVIRRTMKHLKSTVEPGPSVDCNHTFHRYGHNSCINPLLFGLQT